MKENDRLEAENKRKIHYFIFGHNFKKTLKKLDQQLTFYRIAFDRKIKGREIIYDVPNNLLSNAGIVLSKQYEDDKIYFKVRKISQLPGGFKRPSQKFKLGESEDGEHPKDFPMQISSAISNAFSNVFTIDLVSIVRQTEPKIQIDIKGDMFKIYGGTGYVSELLCETAVYRDLETNKHVKRYGVTLILPKDEKFEKENQIILHGIDHSCKELVSNNESRFELAYRLLHPESVDRSKFEKNEDEEDQEENQETKKEKEKKKK